MIVLGKEVTPLVTESLISILMGSVEDIVPILESLTTAIQYSKYTSDSFGAGIQFLPISDIERIGLNLNYDNTSIDTGSTPASQILAFTQSEGTKFEVFKHNLFGQSHPQSWFISYSRSVSIFRPSSCCSRKFFNLYKSYLST